MSRWHLNDEQRRGYDAREQEGRFAHTPYAESYDYRQGWEERERDERLERWREEERQAEEAAAERAEERRRAEAYEQQRMEEEAYYTSQQPPEPEPDSSTQPEGKA